MISAFLKSSHGCLAPKSDFRVAQRYSFIFGVCFSFFFSEVRANAYGGRRDEGRSTLRSHFSPISISPHTSAEPTSSEVVRRQNRIYFCSGGVAMAVACSVGVSIRPRRGVHRELIPLPTERGGRRGRGGSEDHFFITTLFIFPFWCRVRGRPTRGKKRYLKRVAND